MNWWHGYRLQGKVKSQCKAVLCFSCGVQQELALELYTLDVSTPNLGNFPFFDSNKEVWSIRGNTSLVYGLVAFFPIGQHAHNFFS